MNWSSLPSEILFFVFGRLDLRSLLRSSSVCKSWRLNISDDHYWKNLYNVDYPFDNTKPNENQTWKLIYIRKLKSFRAIENGNIYIKNIVANHETHIKGLSTGPSVSMYKDYVIATTSLLYHTYNETKDLGCHAKNIYTEEVYRVPGGSWGSIVIGDYLLSPNINRNVNNNVKPKSSVEWHTVQVTKISSDISDIEISSERNIPWHDQPCRHIIYNADPTFTEMIGIDTQSSVLYNWLKNERTDLGRIIGTPIAFHKETLVTKAADILYVYKNLKLEQKFCLDFDIRSAVVNDNLLACSIDWAVSVFDRRKNYDAFKIEQERVFHLFLFDDLLVYPSDFNLNFYDVNARKILYKVTHRGLPARNILRHSPNEFILDTYDSLMLLRFEFEPRTISVMHVTASGELKEITIKSNELLNLAVKVLESSLMAIYSSYIIKKPSGEKYIMLFNGMPNKKTKKNVKAKELLKKYFHVTSDHLYMPFCPYTTEDPEAFEHEGQPIKLDRDIVVRGDVIIYCEQIVNGKSELVKPDTWPAELRMKMSGKDKQGNDNKKSKKKK